jgi:hypothetical protein
VAPIGDESGLGERLAEKALSRDEVIGDEDVPAPTSFGYVLFFYFF